MPIKVTKKLLLAIAALIVAVLVATGVIVDDPRIMQVFAAVADNACALLDSVEGIECADTPEGGDAE